MQLDLQQLLGPYGLVVATLIAVGFLSRELFKFIREYILNLQRTIEQQNKQLVEALEGWRAQTDANKVLAEAQETRNRDDELRRRIADAGKDKP